MWKTNNEKYHHNYNQSAMDVQVKKEQGFG